MMQSALTAVRTRRGPLAAALVVAGALVLLALSGGRARRAGAIAPTRTFELRGAYLTAGASFSADQLLRSPTTPLVVVTPTARGGAQARVIVNRRAVAVRRLALPGGPGERRLVRWSGGRVGVALLRQQGGSVDVAVASLDTGRRFAGARVGIPAHARVAAQVGPWAGEPNDLFVLTWPPAPRAAERATGARPLPQLAVLGGEPPFQRPVLDVGIPLADGRPGDWEVLVARVSGPAPDLVLVRRRGGAPEVHVLSGESHFQQFILHEKLDLAPAVARRAQFVAALRAGKPVLWAIDPGTRRATVRSFPLGAPATG